MKLASIIQVVSGQGMSCLYCDEEESIANCRHHVLSCSHNEECFLETRLSNQYHKVYYAGCRSTTLCLIIKQLGAVGRKRDVTLCTQCCETTDPAHPCNANLCGEGHSNVDHLLPTTGLATTTTTIPTTTTLPTPNPLHQCLVCDAVTDITLCTTVKSCADTQVCSSKISITELASLKFELGCMDKHVCDQAAAQAPTGKKRYEVEICAACCLGNKCNGKHTCQELRSTMAHASAGVIG